MQKELRERPDISAERNSVLISGLFSRQLHEAILVISFQRTGKRKSPKRLASGLMIRRVALTCILTPDSQRTGMQWRWLG